MPRFSVSSIPALALAGSGCLYRPSSPVAASAQAQVSPQMRGEAIALMQVCRGDYDRLCAGVHARRRTGTCLSPEPCEPAQHRLRTGHAARPGAQGQRGRRRRACRSNGSVGHGVVIPQPLFRGLILVTAIGFMVLEYGARPARASRHPRSGARVPRRSASRSVRTSSAASRPASSRYRSPSSINIGCSTSPRPARRPCSGSFSAPSSSITGSIARRTAFAGCGPRIRFIIRRPSST